MNLSVNTISNNINFGNRRIKYDKESMDKILFPILNRGGEFDAIVSESGYSIHALLEWFKESLGITVAQYFKQQKLAALKKEFLELNQKGFSTKEIAEHYNRKYKWAYDKSIAFGISTNRAALWNRMDENMLGKIQSGDTIDIIAKDLNCSPNTASKWVKKNLKSKITKYRHENNIFLLGKNKEKLLTIKSKMEKYFAEGRNMIEVGKLMGISISQVYKYKKILNLKTKADLAHEFMAKYLPDMIKADWSIKMISDVTGVPDTTVSREYKKLTGFSYRELHNII